MFTAYIAVSLLAAAANGYAATLDFLRHPWQGWVCRNGGCRCWASSKQPALGLLVGIGVPVIGTAAAAGLVLFFVDAITTHLRARDYSLGPAVVFLLLAVAALVLRWVL